MLCTNLFPKSKLFISFNLLGFLQPPVPEQVAKFCNTDAGRPVVGTERIHHGRASDEDLASRFYHGVSTASSLKVSINFVFLFSKDSHLSKKLTLFASKQRLSVNLCFFQEMRYQR